MFSSQHITRLIAVLLFPVSLILLQAHANEVDDLIDHVPIGKGKWQCDYKLQKECSWGKNQPIYWNFNLDENRPDKCVETDGQEWSDEEYASFEHFIFGQYPPANFQYELDLSAKPIKLYFCTKTGCVAGRFEDEEVTLKTLGGVIGYAMAVYTFSGWTAVFPVEVGIDMYVVPMWYMFRVRETLSSKPRGKKHFSSLSIVSNTSLIYLVGQCRVIDNLSEPGNPLDLYKERENQGDN